MASRSVLRGAVGAGRRALNAPADVRTVQYLLNTTAGRKLIEEDGDCGPKSIGAIVQFQRNVLRYPHPDGRVDPTGRMITVLLARSAARARAAQPAVEQDESWTDWAGRHLASVRGAMAGAWASLFREEARTRRAVRPGPASAPGATQVGLTNQDYVNAAASLGTGIDPILVRAVAEVESSGSTGFNAAGLPIIAYEGHWFRRLTDKIYDESHPLLSYPYKEKAGWQWQANNKDQTTAWKTLRSAMELNADAALQSCSWGMCQVMGFNFAKAGYRDVFTFVEAMKRGSRGQLEAFVGYCRERPGMISALRRKDFRAIAFAYNGEDYGDYDRKFARAYARLGGTTDG